MDLIHKHIILSFLNQCSIYAPIEIAPLIRLSENKHCSPLLSNHLIVLGQPGSGKTTAIIKLIEYLRKTAPDLRIGGILQPTKIISHQKHYFLQDILTQETMLLAYPEHQIEIEGQRFDYTFNHDAWKFAADHLEYSVKNCEITILDELGRLEAMGRGHYPAFRICLEAKSKTKWILSIRENSLDPICQRLAS